MTTSPYAHCSICDTPIQEPNRAVVMGEVRGPDRYDNDGGEVRYRHIGCTTGE